MTINIKHEKQMAIMWLVLAVVNLIFTIVNIISKEWLEFILFLDITMLCLNLCFKHWQVAALAEEIEEDESPWISVEDELPPPKEDRPYSERVFVRYIERLGDQEYVRYSFDDLLCIGKIRQWCRHETDNEHVTHWMPIPEIENSRE